MIGGSILGSLQTGRQQNKPTRTVEAVAPNDGDTALHQKGAEGGSVCGIPNLTGL